MNRKTNKYLSDAEILKLLDQWDELSDDDSHNSDDSSDSSSAEDDDNRCTPLQQNQELDVPFDGKDIASSQNEKPLPNILVPQVRNIIMKISTYVFYFISAESIN